MKLATDEIREVVARALAEDLGSGDVTSEAVVAEDAEARATIVQKQAGRAVRLRGRRRGVPPGRARAASSRLVVEGQWRDERAGHRGCGSRAPRGRCSPASAPRSTSSATCPGIATLTARFVEAVEGSGARILDTRKTTPGLRALEKAAVAAGGGTQPPHGPRTTRS